MQKKSGQFENFAMPVWNLTDEILPDREGLYLICEKDGSVFDAYFNGTWFSNTGAGGSWDVDAIAWMNLPKPLKA